MKPNYISKDDQRRLNSLIRQEYYRSKEGVKFWETTRKKSYDIIMEAHSLFDRMKISEDDRRSIWLSANMEQSARHKEYKKTPIRVRQDNKNSINYGSGSPGHSTIRYPKKNRKTAWKRFYKLFPHLDPKNKATQ